MKKIYIKDKEGFRQLCRKRKLTFVKLAELAKIERKTLYRMFESDVMPRFDTLNAISNVLSVPYTSDEKGIYFYLPDETEYSVKVINGTVKEPQPTPFNAQLTKEDLELLQIIKDEKLTKADLQDWLHHIHIRRKRPNLNPIYEALIISNDHERDRNHSDKKD